MSTGTHQCSRCLRRFRSRKSAEAHIRQLHKGRGEVVPYKRKPEPDDEPSMADRAVQAELDRAMGIPNDDIDWLLS